MILGGIGTYSFDRNISYCVFYGWQLEKNEARLTKQPEIKLAAQKPFFLVSYKFVKVTHKQNKLPHRQNTKHVKYSMACLLSFVAP